MGRGKDCLSPIKDVLISINDEDELLILHQFIHGYFVQGENVPVPSYRDYFILQSLVFIGLVYNLVSTIMINK